MFPGLIPLLTIRLCSALARHMRALVLSWVVFQITGSAFALGTIGLVEAIPYIANVLWAGEFVDRSEKRGVIQRAAGGLGLCSLGFALLDLSSGASLYVLFALVALLGFFVSFATVSFTSYSQTLIPTERYPQVFAWSVGIFQGAMIAGPICAGWMIATIGAVPALAMVALLEFTTVLVGYLLPRQPPKEKPEHSSALRNVQAGLKFIASKKVLWAPMVLDMVAVLFGDVIAILPVFAELLNVGPTGLGILRSAPPCGAILVTLVQSFRPVVPLSWAALRGATTVFGASMIFFALSQDFVLSCLLLVAGGVADGVSTIIRHSTYQAHTPDLYRGRVAAVNGIFIRTSNEIGAFESGVAATLLGTVPSVIFGGAMALAVTAFMSWKVPRVEEMMDSSRSLR